MLKLNTILYIKPLTHLVNSSINKGIFSDELNIAKVIPSFKSGNKESIENYRPISILSVFTKVMYNHLINFVDKNNILYKYQFGFRRQHSTNHAVITLVEKNTNALDKITIEMYGKRFIKLEPSLKLLHSAWMMLQAVKV